MAKGKKKQQTNGVAVEDVVAEALTAPEASVVATTPDGPTPPTTAPATTNPATPTPVPTRATPTPVPPPAPDHHQEGVVDTAVATASEVARFVNALVPQRLPAYLGGAALLVLGVVDPPLVLGGVLAYEAIRHWGPAPKA
ncbi:hypothetical protein [Actinomycetospora chibensis]|uniref:Uncharacterized protein n=1 Tax=Actinomycetospora chibensis TaxID=663606 RepID=A0ABV9RGA4_9PSEU|nr:hypothetical protein [Actinomycetospora chibensis]MDD7926731.1 hypothetical protein [Actinomycetospora chibensis]